MLNGTQTLEGSIDHDGQSSAQSLTLLHAGKKTTIIHLYFYCCCFVFMSNASSFHGPLWRNQVNANVAMISSTVNRLVSWCSKCVQRILISLLGEPV